MVDIGPCEVWDGGCTKGGYGYTQYQNKQWLVHRLEWHLKIGPIPTGMSILHHCDNPPCKRLSHLFIGDQSDNMMDCSKKGRLKRKGAIGERNQGAKLSESDIVEIRSIADQQAHSRGIMYERLAEQYGVSAVTIKAISIRKTWKHVPGDPTRW